MKSIFRCLAGLLAVIAFSTAATAQQNGGDTGQGDFGQGGTGTGGAIGIGESTAIDALNPESAFAAIERNDTVGSNNATVGREEDLGSGGAGGAAGGLFGGGAGGGLGGFGGLGGLGSLFGFGGTGNQDTRPPLRTRLRSAVVVAPIEPQSVQINVNRRIQALATRPSLRGVSVTVVDRTAVLTGVVSTPQDRRMSELLLRLEPGVSRVDNRVIVAE